MDGPRPGRARWPLLGLALLVVFSATVRIRTALTDEAFRAAAEATEVAPVGDGDMSRVAAAGLLRSDPALLFYLLQHFVGEQAAVGQAAVGDWRADPRIEHPRQMDVAAEFTLGSEFLLAGSHRACAAVFGEAFPARVPLHVFCVVVMAFVASLALVGAFLFAREWTGSPARALLACTLLALMPAFYRTIGFVLMREDLSWPLFALHLGLAARAARRGTAGAYALSAFPLGLALATWHAAGIFFALEVLALLSASLLTGRAWLQRRNAIAFVSVWLVFALLVPVLRAKQAWLSPAGLGLWALLLATFVERGPTPGGTSASVVATAASRRSFRLRLAACLGGVLVLVAGLDAAGMARGDDYGHVLDFVLAKLLHLGQLPPDPRALSFDARLLWQGPFATPSIDPGSPWTWMTVVLAGLAALQIRQRWSPCRAAALVAFFLAYTGLAALLVQRAAFLPALLLCTLAVGVRLHPGRQRLLAGTLLALASIFFARFVVQHEIRWLRPLGLVHELRELLLWSERNLPPDAVVLGDFVTSPAILAHTGRAIVLQPKYEAGESRARARAFFDAFFFGTPEELRRLACERFGATHLVVDRYTLGVLSRYVAGVPPGVGLRPGTPAALFTGLDRDLPSDPPGYRRVYPDGATSESPQKASLDLYRVYELER